MNKKGIERIIDNLLAEIEEEDIGISLFAIHYSEAGELSFFEESARVQVEKILKTLSADSLRHKKILMRIIGHLEEKCHEG